MIFASSNTLAQEKVIYSGFYIDSFKYIPKQIDTFKFEFYENGFTRLEETRDMIKTTDLRELKSKKINYLLHVLKSSSISEYDSFKTVFYYKNDKNCKSINFQKIAFKENKGCIVYPNKRTSYWYQTGFSIYEYDKKGYCVSQKDFYDDDGYRDTVIFQNHIVYDEESRITEVKNYKNDSLIQVAKYFYADNYKKTETYNSNEELINAIEDFTIENRLTKSTEYSKYGRGATVEKLFYYKKNGRLEKVETFNIKMNNDKERIQVRTYIYNL